LVVHGQLSFVVVHDFDVEGISVAELETNSPGSIDVHGPLVLSIALQFVQSNARQRAEIRKAFSDVQDQQKIHGRFDVGASKSIWPLTLPNLSRRGVTP
jgi:hypothetical protein